MVHCRPDELQAKCGDPLIVNLPSTKTSYSPVESSEIIKGSKRNDEFFVSPSQSKKKNSFESSQATAITTWPFGACGLDLSKKLTTKNNLFPHVKAIKDAIGKAVNGNLNEAATGIWQFVVTNRDDDHNSVGTLDTLQVENVQLRRLGSWGTVGTGSTNSTYDTTSTNSESGKTPKEILVGNKTNDPTCIEDPLKTQERRPSRRHKLVKFAYPPVTSLRLCPRPTPEALPLLFFTEEELSQIEDDRYSTMSTDDIEIVAVVDCSQREPQTTFSDTPAEARQSPITSDVSELKETDWTNVKRRPTTPYRRRHIEDDEEADFTPPQCKTSSNSRLVKGVQIFLRERSTGA